MSRRVSPTSGRPSGLASVGRARGLARSTVHRHREPPRAVLRQRPGPVGPMPDAELADAIRAVLAASPSQGEGHRTVWARRRFAGVRPSRRRVPRLMRRHGLLAPSRVGSPRGPRPHDGTTIPETIDTMWGTDLTTTATGEGQAAVLVAVDHCSAECVGIHAARHASRFEAPEPLRQGGAATSAASPRTPPAACPSGTTTAASTSPLTSNESSASSASRARRRSSERRRGTAAPSG